MNSDQHNINTGGGQPPGNSEVCDDSRSDLFVFISIGVYLQVCLFILVPESKISAATAS